MNPSHHLTEEAIYQQAMKLTSPPEREAFLLKACGEDATLLAKVRELLAYEAEKNDIEREVSRLDQLVGSEMVRIDTSNKTLMDAIKITARNVFYRVLAPFKTAYNNYRDDHAFFRGLTDSVGLLRWTGHKIEVHLVRQVDHAPKLQKIIINLLNGRNEKAPQLADGSGRPNHLQLTSRDQIEVKVFHAPR